MTLHVHIRRSLIVRGENPDELHTGEPDDLDIKSRWVSISGPIDQ